LEEETFMDDEDSFDGSTIRASLDQQTESLYEVAGEAGNSDTQIEERNLSGFPLNDSAQGREGNRRLVRSFDIIRRLKKETA
jgi:hypothetical protein